MQIYVFCYMELKNYYLTFGVTFGFSLLPRPENLTMELFNG